MRIQIFKCIGTLFLLVVFLGACSPVPVTTTAPSPQTAVPQGKSGTIRYGTFSTPNASSMAWLMALGTLKKQGYGVEPTVFASSDTTIAALARGDIDIAGVSVGSWAAIPKGAKITSIVAHNANTFSIAATQAIKSCSDLNGRNFAVGSAGTINAVLVNLYIKQNCPTSAPIFATISDSQAREAALLGGQMDATTVEIADMEQLDAQAPGKFHTLVQFSTAFPTINFTIAMVNRDFAAAHPEMVKDYVRSIVTVNREMRANPQLLYDAMVKELKYSPEEAKATADAYLAAGVWDPNGGLSEKSIETTLGFLSEQGTVPTTLKVEDVSDLSYLNSVLDEMGRK